ncbi:OmpA family protein [Nocardiopsis sp. RV163]|uniref:OmpA family protein n=1 Tax=Nocardiopsis sp. RV163 TaxID=1661388 RepID=UPI001F2E0DF9|nr:OmpA family protein [Nocardiopsis sp. RV163]
MVNPDDNSSAGQNSDAEPPSSSRPGNSNGSSGQEVLASSTSSSTAIGDDLQIDVYALENMSPGLLRLRFGVTNKSDSDFTLNFGLTVDDKPNTASRVSLIDAQNQKRILSYERGDGSCVCSTWNGNIASGQTEEMWVAFPPPVTEDVEALTVTTPLTPPLMDIPISQSSETLESEDLASPEILDLTFISDNTEDQTGRTEDGEEISILLSSDVLFETNSAVLSSDAQEILEQVASEIDDASSDVVQVDGHADNTGSESVNVPLSLERAEAVESVLSELVTRGEVTFDVEGHGASDPIADNDTEEGRERNRRVSVTFEK